jgi:hypothetical protein
MKYAPFLISLAALMRPIAKKYIRGRLRIFGGALVQS